MMNENNEVFTMEDEPLATVVQNMRKGSKWLSAFLESYRPPLDGERYLTDREVAELLRVSRRTLQEYRNNRVLPFILLGGRNQSAVDMVAFPVEFRFELAAGSHLSCAQLPPHRGSPSSER